MYLIIRPAKRTVRMEECWFFLHVSMCLPGISGPLRKCCGATLPHFPASLLPPPSTAFQTPSHLRAFAPAVPAAWQAPLSVLPWPMSSAAFRVPWRGRPNQLNQHPQVTAYYHACPWPRHTVEKVGNEEMCVPTYLCVSANHLPHLQTTLTCTEPSAHCRSQRALTPTMHILLSPQRNCQGDHRADHDVRCKD